ncbi:MAG TPA: hypothetical protein VHL78_08355 [Actinomycetota bacterium]|nr:hypothetical protein [Actinomycetota bacterium]
MLELLIVLSVAEAALVLAVLVLYLLMVLRRLRKTASVFGRVAFGVRAVETQTSSIGPSVTRINRTLEEIAAALPAIAEKAERSATPNRAPR